VKARMLLLVLIALNTSKVFVSNAQVIFISFISFPALTRYAVPTILPFFRHLPSPLQSSFLFTKS